MELGSIEHSLGSGENITVFSTFVGFLKKIVDARNPLSPYLRPTRRDTLMDGMNILITKSTEAMPIFYPPVMTRKPRIDRFIPGCLLHMLNRCAISIGELLVGRLFLGVGGWGKWLFPEQGCSGWWQSKLGWQV